MERIQRIAYLDTVKATCIFLMVVGHWTNCDLLITYIYSFHMPALFVVSGILYHQRPWMKTVLSFGIPITFYSILNLLFLLITREVNINQIYTKEMLCRFIHYRYGLCNGLFMGDWFIWALLTLRFLFGDIRFLGFFRNYYIYIGFFAITYMAMESRLINVDALFHGYYIGKALPSLPFFALGLFLKDKGWHPENLSNKIKVLLLCIFIILPLINGYCSINENEYGFSYTIFFINATCSVLFLLNTLSIFSSSKALIIFSKGTLLILGLHMPILKIMDMLFPQYLHELLPLFVLPICYYPILWLDKWCPELLGKPRRNIIKRA